MDNKKRGYYKSRIPPPEKIPSTRDLIEKDQAISFLTEKIGTNESWRDARGKVAKQVNYAVESGELQFENERIVFGKLIAWARTKPKWNGKLSGIGHLIDCDSVERMGFGDSSSNSVLCGNLEDAHKQQLRTDALIESLERKIKEHQETIAQREPKAKR